MDRGSFNFPVNGVICLFAQITHQKLNLIHNCYTQRLRYLNQYPVWDRSAEICVSMSALRSLRKFIQKDHLVSSTLHYTGSFDFTIKP
jgi:hypothetical protein